MCHKRLQKHLCSNLHGGVPGHISTAQVVSNVSWNFDGDFMRENIKDNQRLLNPFLHTQKIYLPFDNKQLRVRTRVLETTTQEIQEF